MRTADRIPELLPKNIDAVLVAGGSRPRKGSLTAIVSRSKRVIAIDGGLRHLRSFGIIPQYVIGDLDSARAEDIAWARRRRAHVILRSQQQDSDIDKALAFCKQRKWKSVAIAGVDGDRIDHFVYSLSRVTNIRGLKPVLLFQKAIGRVLAGSARVELPVGHGKMFSWLGVPLANGASLSGAKWPFAHRTLEFAAFQSLSNIAVEDRVTFSQRSGKSLIIIPIGKV